jgi:hypothetical protein
MPPVYQRVPTVPTVGRGYLWIMTLARRLLRPLPALVALSVYLVLVTGPTPSGTDVDAEVGTGLVTTTDGR